MVKIPNFDHQSTHILRVKHKCIKNPQLKFLQTVVREYG